MPPQIDSGVAYLLWFTCFLGFCGGQRFYTGKIGSGLLYLFTFGLFGFGQAIDLVLIPGMVSSRNRILRERYLGDQRLLKAAKAHGGTLSLAQAALHTELEPAALKALLQEAQQLDYAEVTNDPKTGAVRYRFDV
jgi:TM2 domain-containing membrane protein YozV